MRKGVSECISSNSRVPCTASVRVGSRVSTEQLARLSSASHTTTTTSSSSTLVTLVGREQKGERRGGEGAGKGGGGDMRRRIGCLLLHRRRHSAHTHTVSKHRAPVVARWKNRFLSSARCAHQTSVSVLVLLLFFHFLHLRRHAGGQQRIKNRS